jgi:hypothetical protein
MKKILLLMSFFLPISLFAYYGNVQNFIIEENSICLNAPQVASQSYLSTDSRVSQNAKWSVDITLSFAPTSSNYLKWFVMADSSNVNTSSSGYYLLFGGTSRTVSFYVVKNGKSSLVHQEREKLLDNPRNHIKVSLTRLESNNWVLELVLNDTLTTTSNFYEDQVNYSSFFGWHCVYTKTRSQAFCFANAGWKGEQPSTPRLPKEGEILINEILFNPVGDGVDFVELLNVSDTIFDISNCILGNKKQTYTLPTFLLYPDSMVAIAKDSALLCSQYYCKNPQNILQVEKMLPLPNDSGFIKIMCDSAIIDTLYYKADMHHIHLNNIEGISLERTTEGNWLSASTILRATPGYKNSRSSTKDANDYFSEEENDTFKLLSSSVHIYNPEYPENIVLLYRLQYSPRVTVKVYTLHGFPVYTIIDSELLSGEGKLFWDGRGNDSEILPVGMYVIVVELYSENSTYALKKLPVAIIP